MRHLMRHTTFVEREKAHKLLINGAGAQTRTADLRITNALLYQLSYTGIGRDAQYIIGACWSQAIFTGLG